MTDLADLLGRYVADGSVPGVVALIARGEEVEEAVLGSATLGETPMTRNAIFRLASITKPITAAAVMILVEEDRVSLHDPVETWLPELSKPSVVRTPASPVNDLVPATRPITVFDLLTSRAGYGFPSDFTLPAVQRLFEVQKDGREPQSFLPQDAWMAALSDIPMLYQPGEAWLYDTCSVLQGVLVSRVSGQSLSAFLTDRIFQPLEMDNTGFVVPARKLERLTSYYRASPGGSLELVDGPDGQWSTPPPIFLGNGGLAGTADDGLPSRACCWPAAPPPTVTGCYRPTLCSS